MVLRRDAVYRQQEPGAGDYFNKTQGTPLYTPDLDRPAFRKEWLKSQAGRLTWQVSPKNKVNAFVDVQSYQVRGRGAYTAPESHSCWAFSPQGLYQASWSSPLTSKFLLEAGASLTKGAFPCTLEQLTDIFGFTPKPTDVSILEATTGFRYNAASSYRHRNDHDRYAQRFSVSYVTGSHTFKTGMQLQQGVLNVDTEINRDVTYTFVGGVPSQITQWATPYLQKNRMKADLGLFVQDQWAVKRLTLNYGLRFDYFNGYVPAQHVDAGQFVGARDFAAVPHVPEWNDMNPRLGGSYDLFGNGRTAVKTSLGRYVGQAVDGRRQLQQSDRDLGQQRQPHLGRCQSATMCPDCNLTDFGANGECGPISNANFGRINPGRRPAMPTT